MTSSNTEKDVILKAARVGCTNYMIKPTDKTRLYNEIASMDLIFQNSTDLVCKGY